MAKAARPFWRSLYFQVLVGIALGVLVGWLWPDWGRALKPLGDGFIKLVKMIITPVIFLTVVTGIAGMARPEGVRPGRRSRRWPISSPSRRWRWRSASIVANFVRPGAGLNVDPATLDTPAVAELCQPGARAERHRLPARHHPRHPGQRLHRGRDPPGAAGRDPVRHRAGAGRRRAASRLLDLLKTLTAIVFRIVHILMYAGAARRVRGDGLHHRPIWHRHLANLAALVADLLRDLAAVRDRRARRDRAGRRLLDLRPDPLSQGRAAAGARHLLVRKRAAAADGEARAGRLPQADRRPGRPDRLFVQPRRHLHLHVAGRPVHRPGLQHPALARRPAAADGGRDRSRPRARPG